MFELTLGGGAAVKGRLAVKGREAWQLERGQGRSRQIERRVVERGVRARDVEQPLHLS